MYLFQRRILQAIAARLRKKIGDRITGMYAFGSRVRGDHGAWSDLDVLVVVRERTPAIAHEIIGIFVEEELNTGIPFAPVIKDIRSFEQEKRYHSPFYENIVREGIAL
jgi:predicted nucleotidyltransferase